MPHIFTTEGLVAVVDSQFVITTGISDFQSAPPPPSTKDFVTVAASSVRCVSLWNSHDARVQLDYWSDLPAALVGWDRQHTQSLRRGRGPAQVLSVTGRVACELDVDIPEDTVIQARIATRIGDNPLEATTDQTVSTEAVEQWLVQLWPNHRVIN